MEKILEVFGIDWRLLAINIINFGLLLWALHHFFYGPLMDMLEKRRQKVEEGVRSADLAQRKLKKIEESRTEILAKAGREADELLARGREGGIAKEKELTAAGEAAAAALLQDAEKQASEAKARAIAESKEDVAKLIVLGMEKMMSAKGGSASGGKDK